MNRTRTLAHGVGGGAAAQFAADVRDSLTRRPRQLASRYLYDDLGSALFEAICLLPWYGITRAEERLLSDHAADLFRTLAPPAAIVELGSGSGEKLRTLLQAGDLDGASLEVHLVDLSPSALERSARTLASFDGLRIVAHEAPYEAGLNAATAAIERIGPTLVLFLGSNIGNFDPPASDALLRAVRHRLERGDGLLLGADLVKPERELTLAYDDPLGVTAAFNRNLLARVNRELGGTFALEAFAHRAVWNAAESRMEMYLVSQRRQEVRIEAADLALTLQEGEAIWTESSYKYRPEDLARMLDRAGFRVAAQWIDRRSAFALTLAEAV